MFDQRQWLNGSNTSINKNCGWCKTTLLLKCVLTH